MRTIGWSSLFLGTVLATGALGVRAEEPAATPSGTAEPTRARTNDDEDAAIRFYTGSIRSLDAPTGRLGTPSAPTGALRELSPATTPPIPAAAPAKPITSGPAAPVAATTEEKAPATPAPAVEEKTEPAASVSPTTAPEPVADTASPSAPATAAATAEPASATTQTRPVSTPDTAATEAAPQPAVTEAPASPEPPVAAAATEAAPAARSKLDPATVATEEPATAKETPALALPSAETLPARAPQSEALRETPPATETPALAATPVEPPPAAAETAPVAITPSVEPSTTASVAPTTPEAPMSRLPEPTDAPAATSVPSPADPVAATAPTIDPAAEEADRAALAAALDARPPANAEDKADRADLAAFYESRADAFLFVDPSGQSAVGRIVGARLARAAEDGLEPRDYALPNFAGGTSEARARTEIATALAAVRYARHLQTGRFAPSRVSDLVTPRPPKTSAAEMLDRLAMAADTDAVLASYAPPHVGYARLKKVLADLRATAVAAPTVQLPTGPILKPGQKNERVALLRERLGVSTVANDATVYDPALAEAVKAFQRDRGLPANGAVGRDTVVALNDPTGGSADRIADVIVNMERWRWLPRDLGELHVFVNVPDFRLDVIRDGRSIHRAKVITGRPENQTPIFSETMKYVVVNPYWNVPVSIIRKEMLGKAQETRGEALTRGNYEVAIGNHTVDPTTVDWSQVPPDKVEIRQRPGDGNALGNIKFMFPNQHSVYIHDTSSRGLFAQSYRALSHGCVRVHEPFAFADAVLSEEPGGLDGARLKAMLGKGEKQVNLDRAVPVHITYFTDFVGDDGRLEMRRDIYGHDARMKRLLGL